MNALNQIVEQLFISQQQGNKINMVKSNPTINHPFSLPLVYHLFNRPKNSLENIGLGISLYIGKTEAVPQGNFLDKDFNCHTNKTIFLTGKNNFIFTGCFGNQYLEYFE